jgi:hypothetical protein
MNRKNFSPTVCSLEVRTVLSPTNPVIIAEGDLGIQEDVQLDLILLQQTIDMIEDEVREFEELQKWADDQFIKITTIPPPPPEIIIVPAPQEDPTYWETFLNAVDSAIETITNVNSPVLP